MQAGVSESCASSWWWQEKTRPTPLPATWNTTEETCTDPDSRNRRRCMRLMRHWKRNAAGQPEVTFAEVEETYRPVCEEAGRVPHHSLDGTQQPSLEADVGQQLEDILSMTSELAREFVQGEGSGALPHDSNDQDSATQPREGGGNFFFSQFAFPTQDV
uniref:Uncharacterized protein n=1 Tax=Dunaliella tertiolecta TaxID=3047 RepID=A0A7S3R811_DUNTE